MKDQAPNNLFRTNCTLKIETQKLFESINEMESEIAKRLVQEMCFNIQAKYCKTVRNTSYPAQTSQSYELSLIIFSPKEFAQYRDELKKQIHKEEANKIRRILDNEMKEGLSSY